MLRQLRADDAQAYADFRRQALLAAPLAFASSPEDDIASSPEAVRDLLRRAPDSVIIGAFREQLIGAVGLYRDRNLKCAHKAHLWGMYVVSDCRRQGIASELLVGAIGHARSLPGVSGIHLSVSSAAPAAQRLYERVGFHVWGAEVDAMRHAGQTVVDYHMALQVSGTEL